MDGDATRVTAAPNWIFDEAHIGGERSGHHDSNCFACVTACRRIAQLDRSLPRTVRTLRSDPSKDEGPTLRRSHDRASAIRTGADRRRETHHDLHRSSQARNIEHESRETDHENIIVSPQSQWSRLRNGAEKLGIESRSRCMHECRSHLEPSFVALLELDDLAVAFV